MENRSLENTKAGSHPSQDLSTRVTSSQCHVTSSPTTIVDLSTHNATVVSPNSQNSSPSTSKTWVQVSDHLKQNGENRNSLTPIVEEGQGYNPGGHQINANQAVDHDDSLPELFVPTLSKSLEGIVSAPRKEISRTILHAKTGITDPQDVSFRYFALRMTHSKLFNRLMLFVILVNVLCIAYQNETPQTHHLQKTFWMLSDIFTAIYTVEFALKFYADRTMYWHSVYNVFDFSVLVVAYVDTLMTISMTGHNNKIGSAMRSLRAFRALKIVNFLPGVQVIATALVRTLKELIVDVILLLILLLFAFGVMGYYFFGYDAVNEAVLESWGSLSAAFLSLFTVVTADSWWKFIEELVNDGAYSVALSRAYIGIFLFFGHFITANLFIAVIITNIQSSSNDFKAKLMKEREVLVQDRKREYWRRSRREVKRLMTNRILAGESNFSEIATEFYNSLQRRDFVVKSDLKSNILWLDTVLRELSRAVKNNRKVLYMQRGLVSSIGPVCEISEVDRRKISISTASRYVVKHKSTGLQYLTSPHASGTGRKNSTLIVPDNNNLKAPRLSIFRRKSKLGN